MDADYTKRELDMKFQMLGDKVDENHRETNEQINLVERKMTDNFMEVRNFLAEIKTQTTEHNHRMSKIERTLLIVGTVVLVLLVTNGSKLLDFALSIVK